MVNRIQEILDKYDLTAAKLADQLNVPRSTISHILSERNKPSLEFIQKVLDNFPEINTRWLVKGEGEIFEKDSNLFYSRGSVSENNLKEEISQRKTIDFPDENQILPGNIPGDSDHQNLSKEKTKKEDALNADIETIKTKKNTPQARGRKIVKLITLYDDNTFDEYIPVSDEKN
jgi:transcriptional regulator with XRE-family HTH domain